MTRNAIPSAKSPRAIEIDQLVYFIHTSDIYNARRSIVNLLGRGETISREIIAAYHQLESGR
jgi:hypothetical protein